LLHSMTKNVLPALQLALGRPYPYPQQHQNHHAAAPENSSGVQATSPDQLSDAAGKLGIPHQSRHSGSLAERMGMFPAPKPVLPALASSTTTLRRSADKPLSEPLPVSNTRQLSLPVSNNQLMDDTNSKANTDAHALNLYEQVLLCTSLASDIVGTFAAGGEYCATCAFQSKIAHSLLQIGIHVSEKLRKRLGLSEEEGDANEQLHQMARSAARLRAAMGMDERVPKSLRQSRPGYFALKERRGGIRVLSLDGGGSRIIATLQILKKLEQMCGMRIADMFDVIGGTSSGGLLALAMGLRNKSAQQCEQLTLEIANRVFSHGLLARGKVLLNRGQHDTKALESMFRDELGEDSLIDSRANDIHPHLASTNSDSYPHHFHRFGPAVSSFSSASTTPPQSSGTSPLHRVPMVFAVSTRMGTSSSVPAEPYLHSNYRPPLVSPPLNPNTGTKLPKPPMSRYAHGCHHRIWEAARATTAAPAYFDPLQSGDEVFCDGALCNNNPTAIAVHEARMLFHGVPLELLVSLGCGRADVPQGGEREMQQLVGSGNSSSGIRGSDGGKRDMVSLTKNEKSVGVNEVGPKYAGRDTERRTHVTVGESDLALNPNDTKIKTGGEMNSIANPTLPPPLSSSSSSSTALRVHVMAIARALVDSATDTEAVHHAMEDLAPPHVYYRLNPVLPRDWLILDESRPERLEEIVVRTHEYMKEQEGVIRKVCDVLMSHYPVGSGFGSGNGYGNGYGNGNEKDELNGHQHQHPNQSQQHHHWWERWKSSKL